MTKRKVFSIVMASIALYLFINSFIPYLKSYGTKVNLWDYKGIRVIMLISIIAVITMYLLHIFLNLNEKIMSYANYATGFISLFHVAMFFGNLDHLYVGIWLGLIASLGLVTIAVLWGFMSDEPMGKPKAPAGGKITGYDPQTGKPIFAQPKGFNPQTGEPIYE